MHRFAAELLGEFFADEDVTDRLTLAEPQRLQGPRPGRPPRQLQVGEGLEQFLRAHAVQALDRFVDRITLGCRLVIRAGADGALGVQRPFGAAFTVRAAVHLEREPTAVLQRVQGELHLASSSRAG